MKGPTIHVFRWSVWMEQPVQLIGETRRLLPMAAGHPERYDYEYRRSGTAVNFMFTEPLASWRKVNVRETKTMTDWAEEMRKK